MNHHASDRDADITRHEQELLVGTRTKQTGSVTARKRVEIERHDTLMPREIEHGEATRVAASEGDSGEIITLEDGSVSVPVFEEQLVVEKRLVVRERIVIQKRIETVMQRVEADLKIEHIDIEVDVDPPTR